jgi:hypothetical protein
MSGRNNKKRKKKMKKKARKTPLEFRNPLAFIAHELQRCAGGSHKDKRTRRKNRKSWKKDWDL